MTLNDDSVHLHTIFGKNLDRSHKVDVKDKIFI